jgi:hypothetical protein
MNVQKMESNLAYQVLYIKMDIALSLYQRENVLPLQLINNMSLYHDNEPAITRTERGLTISGTRITLYQIMDYIHANYPRHLIECVDRLIEIALYFENYLGVSRLFIP